MFILRLEEYVIILTCHLVVPLDTPFLSFELKLFLFIRS
uniref:Uncharacterized protein n=1 Tax=Heterorhabditis bacteriophora TaxID=37862 RepID=A0A1I7WV01_HETBA